MNRKEELKKLVNEFGIHTLTNKLNIDYAPLVERHNYEDKLHEKGLEILLNNQDLKTHAVEWVFPLEANGLMLTQDYFISNSNKAYQQLLVITEHEKHINKIFKLSTNLLCCTNKEYFPYVTKYIKFLATVVQNSNSQSEVEKMFEDFNSIKKLDKVDLSPILVAFLDRNISANKVYDSIKDLDNSYLENKLVEYLYQNNIPFSFKVKQVDMFDTEEKIIYEHTIKFNTNYFMKMGVNENQVNVALESFSDFVCNVEGINYLIKKKDRTLSLVLRSENQEVISKLFQQIKQHNNLISEFVENFDNTQEYKNRFMTYWHLNKQFNSKDKTSRHKI